MIHECDIMFSSVNEEGEEVTYTGLFSFDNDNTGKRYVVYTDGSINDEGYTNIFASIIDPKVLETYDEPGSDGLELTPIDTDEEWQAVEDNLEEYYRGLDDILD